MITYLVLALCAASARAHDYDLSELEEAAGDPRLFFANFTSSLVTVNSTLLAYALVGLAIAGAAGLALYYLYLQSASSGAGYGSYGNQYSYSQYGYQSRYYGHRVCEATNRRQFTLGRKIIPVAK